MGSSVLGLAVRIKGPWGDDGIVTRTLLRLVPLVAAAALVGILFVPGAVAVHEDSQVLFDKEYVVGGVKDERDLFGVPFPPDDKPLLCYRRILTPGGLGSWSASLYDGDDDLAIQDVAAWTRVGVNTNPQTAILVKPRIQTGGWTIDVRATGFADVQVTVAWVPDRPTCAHT
jgi:hypothetical protein